jgi:hypothetical protein
VATKAANTPGRSAFVSGGEVVESSRHYWEVLLTTNESCGGNPWHAYGRVRPLSLGSLLVGCVRPCAIDPDRGHESAAERWLDSPDLFLFGNNGALYGNGKCAEGGLAATLASGDRVGVLVDFDEGCIRMFRNGEQYGPGFVSGVEGPLVFCLDIMCADGVTATVVPDAVGPA